MFPVFSGVWLQISKLHLSKTCTSHSFHFQEKKRKSALNIATKMFGSESGIIEPSSREC